MLWRGSEARRREAEDFSTKKNPYPEKLAPANEVLECSNFYVVDVRVFARGAHRAAEANLE